MQSINKLMTDLTSEKIAKDLKGGGLSSQDKIKTACQAWNDNSIFFPNKDDFLFEWICSAFAKPNLNNPNDSCLQLAYWHLFSELLEHYSLKMRSNEKRSSPAIHSNLMKCISTLLEHLYSKNAGSTEDKVNFLAAINKFISLLFTEAFKSSYRPSFEQVSSTVDKLLTCLKVQIGICMDDNENTLESESLNNLCLAAMNLLAKYDAQIIMAANQRKIFMSLVERSLSLFLNVRRRINLVSQAKHAAQVSELLTNIICHVLFHVDTVLEFTSILKDVSLAETNHTQSNYVAKLFEVLQSLVNDKADAANILDAIDITPTLLSAFLESFRYKRNTTTSSMQDISRMAEFGFFINMLKIVSTVEGRKDDLIPHYLKALTRLLKVLLDQNVFTARNDEIAQSQQELLADIAKNAIQYIRQPNLYDQGFVFDLFDTLLQIDYQLVESHIHSLWPSMLNPLDDAREQCLNFATSVLRTYAAVRQIDIFFADLIKHVREITEEDLFRILRQPLFSKRFLTNLSDSVRKAMPAAQALGIFEDFRSNLMLPDKTLDDTHVSKKRKKHSTNATHKHVTTSSLATYFTAFINALKLNTHQLQAFEAPVIALYDDFVKPAMQRWNESKGALCELLIPAMKIHTALSAAFVDQYTRKISTEDRKWLAEMYNDIFTENISLKTLDSRVACTLCVNAMLQHVYQASLLELNDTERHTSLVNAVLDFVTNKKDEKWYLSAQWSGSLVDIDNDKTLKLAIWKLITDEWFDVIVQVLDNERALRFISILFATATSTLNAHESVTASMLSTALLRSANFYEAACLKACNIHTVIRIFIEHFQSICSKKTEKGLSTLAAKMIASMEPEGHFVVDEKDITHLSKSLSATTDNMDLDVVETATNDVRNVCSLMKILLILPNEHYGKADRPRAMHLATLVDIWSVSCANADPAARITLSLMCRTFNLRFMDYFISNSIQGLQSKLIDWQIHSNYDWAKKAIDKQNLSSLISVTNKLDANILRRVIPSAAASETDEHSLKYLKDTLSQRSTVKADSLEAPSLQGLINLLNAVNTALRNRKSTDTDLSNIIYATETISKVSGFVVDALHNAKTTIETISKIKDDSQQKRLPSLDNIDLVLRLTCLLQEYTRIVGHSADEIVRAREIADGLTTLVSPLLQYTQAMLKTADGDLNRTLSIATEFIAAFCSILPRHQQVDLTKRVLATIWFVYQMVLEADVHECSITLSTAFASWVQNLSKEQYTIVIDSFVEQAGEEVNNAKAGKEQHNLTYLILLSSLLTNCVKGERGNLKKQLPKILGKISEVVHVSESVKYIQQTLRLLILLTNEQAYHYNEYEVSFILMCLTQVFRPSVAEKVKDQMTHGAAQEIFNDICSILSNLVTLHKEQIVYMLSPFIATVQSLLHCFKSSHVSLVKTSHPNSRKRSRDRDEAAKTKKQNVAGRGVPLLQEFAPLNDTAAHRLARLLSTIPQKNVTLAQQQKNARSAQSLQRIISRHTPSILIEYFAMQSNPTMSVLNPSTKSIITNALYDILDLCTEADRNYVLCQLDGSGKALFKAFYASWKDNHKYTGQ